jgi:hypothetical protein
MAEPFLVGNQPTEKDKCSETLDRWEILKVSINEIQSYGAEYPRYHMYVVQSADARANLSSIETLWYLGRNCTSVRTVHFIGP